MEVRWCTPPQTSPRPRPTPTRSQRFSAIPTRLSLKTSPQPSAAASGLPKAGSPVRQVAGAERQGGPGVVCRWPEALAASAAQRRVRAGLVGRGCRGCAPAGRAQRANCGGICTEHKQAAGGFWSAKPGLGWHLQGVVLPLRLLRAGREDDRAGRQAGLGGNSRAWRQQSR